MSYANREYNRLMEFEKVLGDEPEITAVLHTEDYIPPHKMAGFVPYDAIIAFDNIHWTAGDFEAYLEDLDLKFHKVITVDDNDSQAEGERIAFVSLVEYNPSA